MKHKLALNMKITVPFNICLDEDVELIIECLVDETKSGKERGRRMI